MKKTGFIAIVGRPNVGKSTLLNAILGEKVAIVSSKPQTTRNKIVGIHTVEENQYVFLDTPGMHEPKNSLGDFMVKEADMTMREADAVILVVDVNKPIGRIEENVIAYLKKSGTPAILAVNKIDTCNKEEIAVCLSAYNEKHSFHAFVPISARSGKNVPELLEECNPFLEASEFFFPDDIVTDQTERQIAAEIIREKLLRSLDEEIPHGTAVTIEEWHEGRDNVSIRAEIYCEKQSHKGIIIGKGGNKLKGVGKAARLEIEDLLGCKVFLSLFVKVKEGWRDSERTIRSWGYKDE
jgi:GTP-binding protein Era